MLTLTDPEQEMLVLSEDEEEGMRVYYEESDRHYNKMWWKALRIAIIERCKHEENYAYLNWFCKLLLTFKFYICMILNLKWKPEYSTDDVQVCRVHYSDWYAGWDVEYFTVGYGFFRNWWYRYEEDGDSDM